MPLGKSGKKIIAIDGPSGAGKSTVAKLVAKKLNIPYLDTGKLYRALGWLYQKGVVHPDQWEEGKAILKKKPIAYREGKIYFDGKDITPILLTEEAGKWASTLSTYPAVRRWAVTWQRSFLCLHGGVAEGRDIALRVAPETPYKFYLYADLSIRIWRRAKELKASFREVAQSLIQRDEQDQKREIDPLQFLPEHIPICTDNLTPTQVADLVVSLSEG